VTAVSTEQVFSAANLFAIGDGVIGGPEGSAPRLARVLPITRSPIIRFDPPITQSPDR
jgi:hypothetical protein